GENPTVTQPPDADSIPVDVRKHLEVVRAERGVAEVLPADVHVDAFPPRRSVADAPTVVRGDDDVALLEEILVEAVVDGVVALHVPAVVVLVHAIAVDPDHRRMFLRAV